MWDSEEANVGWSAGLTAFAAFDRRFVSLRTLNTSADEQESLHQSSD
jgi:hypothetical protein